MRCIYSALKKFMQCICGALKKNMQCIKKCYAKFMQCNARKEKYSIEKKRKEKKSILYYTTYSIISFCRKKFFLIIFLENIFRFFGKSDKKAKVKIKKKFSK